MLIQSAINLSQDLIQSPGEQESLAAAPVIQFKPGLVLEWEVSEEERFLRFAIGCDFRDNCVLRFRLLGLDNKEGHIDLSFASHAQRNCIAIPVGCSGLEFIEQEGAAEAWIIVTTEEDDTFVAYAPNIVEETGENDRVELALLRMRDASVCQFSWMGGCVLEGLCALDRAFPDDRWEECTRNWLAHFSDDTHIFYQDPRGNARRDYFTNIEATLPVASFVQYLPDHPAIDFALKMWNEHRQEDGMIADYSATAEGSYTIAYSLLRVGLLRNDQNLIDDAFEQLRFRQKRLHRDGDIYLRHGDQLSFRNWVRGICWYMMGLSRCMELSGDKRPADLAAHLQERSEWIIVQQRSDGLWNNFLDEDTDENGREYPPDTSGSAGIATALLIAERIGLGPKNESAQEAARRCLTGLQQHLEVDGYMGCVAPNNKRGEMEQHTHSRTVEPFALGLYAQLYAELKIFEL